MNQDTPAGHDKAAAYLESPILQDDKGYYKIVTTQREIPRKTYISGLLRGKYRGKIALQKDSANEHAVFYDFHIYEAAVHLSTCLSCSCTSISKQQCNGLHTEAEGEFDLPEGAVYTRESLPQLLPVFDAAQDKPYTLHIYEPQLANVQFLSRLHQTEDKEVFGTIETHITGFLLDLVVAERTERLYLRETAPERNPPAEVITRELIGRLFPAGR